MPTSLGPAEILVILVVALIVLGPKRLPEAGRQVGKALSEVRRWTTDVKSEIKSVVDFESPPARSTVVEPVVVSATESAVVVAGAAPEATSTVVDPVVVSASESAAVVVADPAPESEAPDDSDDLSGPPPESPAADPAQP